MITQYEDIIELTEANIIRIFMSTRDAARLYFRITNGVYEDFEKWFKDIQITEYIESIRKIITIDLIRESVNSTLLDIGDILGDTNRVLSITDEFYCVYDIDEDDNYRFSPLLVRSKPPFEYIQDFKKKANLVYLFYFI